MMIDVKSMLFPGRDDDWPLTGKRSGNLIGKLGRGPTLDFMTTILLYLFTGIKATHEPENEHKGPPQTA
ncbi:hypothetical protein SADUNF_Sadunf10G0198900 [Salix dunnii]|uniref:Uncharacterized protein n=1 Tax=Salix dunnii TaxID=1413687 RepID=A0A835MVM0_9ROSI|nr:hypothetical protein SADUNF_Sadunf10G0198900 [Salix dunnii]